jgi:hypothetical protein
MRAGCFDWLFLRRKEMGDFIGMAIGILVGVIFIFLICREIVCWYWKINRLVDLIEEQNDLIKRQMGLPSNKVPDTISNTDT